MKSKIVKRISTTVILMTLLNIAETVVAQCPFSGSLTSSKSKLYLYFPTVQDTLFPEYDPSAQTSPLELFDVIQLDAGIGTTIQLQDRILNIVQEDYCEFDLEVVATTSLVPAPSESLWQVVGIGTDDETISGSILFGVAQAVDLNNGDPQDYARVYAKSFLNAYGGAGLALNGANSTLGRWATAIGHTASHEAGHNFGLSHGNSSPRTGEDDANWHIMATGSTGLTGEMRASRNRHFGDQEYEILGHNIGLRLKTLHNWDFTNPNAEDAHSLVLTLLSPAATLTLSWSYGGAPWTAPTVASAGTQSFQGTTYNKYTLTFSAPKAWSGGAPGVVPGGAEFHVGAAFTQPDLVIVFETRLKDSGNANLNLHPRLVGFDAGDVDFDTGDFRIRAFNPEPARAMIIEDLRIAHLPRMASIESMIRNAEPRDLRGGPIAARPPSRSFAAPKSLEVREQAGFTLASFKDARAVELFYDDKNCKRGFKPGAPGASPQSSSGPGDVDTGEMEYCPKGWALSLFPSTYVYLTATVVEPNAKYWDKAQAKYVTGPLRSKIFYQFSGIVPDFNKNGIDDLIDIRTGVSKDKNNNGIVDESEKDRQPPSGSVPWWWCRWWWIVVALVLIFIVWLLLRRKS